MLFKVKPKAIVTFISVLVVSLPTFLLIGLVFLGEILLPIWQISIVLICIASIGSAFIAYMNALHTQYEFDENSVTFYEGFFTKRKKVIEYRKITDISNLKSFPLDMIFDTGTIVMMTAGGTNAGISMKHIDSPENVYEKLKELLDKSKGNAKPNYMNESKINNTAELKDNLNENNIDNFSVKVIPFAETIRTNFTPSFYYIAFISMVTFFVVIATINPSPGYGIFELNILLIGAVAYLLPTIIFLTIFSLSYKNNASKIYNFNSKGIEYDEGFLTKRKVTINYERITDISYSRSWFWDNIFDTGSIYISTAGTTNMHKLIMSSIKDTENVYEKLKIKLVNQVVI